MLRSRLGWDRESAEIVNIGSGFIPYKLGFRRGLPEVLKKKLHLAAIIGKVAQTAGMVKES
jgi:hypothetical protein